GVTYAHKLTKEETQIDWKMSAEEIARRVRAFAPWPGSWTLCETEVIRLHVVQPISFETFQPTAENAVPGTIVSEDPLVVACGAETFLQIWRLQRAGKKTMDAPDFLNGFQVTASRQFS
ncbi:methionyl-tRNA formyltransferase, partial [Alphaproteobacteria bacterium]|nr:methionyl-tRNA formyltransferase [Alphaproteobacteria bacterium]